MTPIFLLPGLDGTAQLFSRFIDAAPPRTSVIPITLPARASAYEDLASAVADELPEPPAVLVAESFSGPIAILVARRRRVAGLVLCNTFIDAPRSGALRWAIIPAVFKIPLPTGVIRRFLLDARADDELLRDVARTVRSVPAAVLAARVRSVLQVDVTNEFKACTAPLLYLRGTEDGLVPDAAVRRMQAVNSMVVASIPGPHLLLQANPRGAWEAMSPFIRSLPAV